MGTTCFDLLWLSLVAVRRLLMVVVAGCFDTVLCVPLPTGERSMGIIKKADFVDLERLWRGKQLGVSVPRRGISMCVHVH